MQTVKCVCVCVFERERERERESSLGIHFASTSSCFFFRSFVFEWGLSFVSHFDKLLLAPVCNVYNIYAADLSEKCSL